MSICKRGLLALLGVLCLFSLPGCGDISLESFLQPGIDELLHPPKLTQEQKEISSALEAAVGAGRAEKLKYPRRGEYLSAFVMYDLEIGRASCRERV